MKLEKIKLIVGLFIALATLVGIVLTVDKYFAKSEEVEISVGEIKNENELVQERLDISITDDQIFQQQQHIQQMKNYQIFEQRSEAPELTSLEKEALKNAEERLEELKSIKSEKLETYKRMKK